MTGNHYSRALGLLPDTLKCGLRMHRGCREHFLRHRGLAIPTYIMARVRHTCCDVCRDSKLVVSFEISGRENVPGIPGACATRNITYLVKHFECFVCCGQVCTTRDLKVDHVWIPQRADQVIFHEFLVSCRVCCVCRWGGHLSSEMTPASKTVKLSILPIKCG